MDRRILIVGILSVLLLCIVVSIIISVVATSQSGADDSSDPETSDPDPETPDPATTSPAPATTKPPAAKFKPSNEVIRSKHRDNFCLDVGGWSKENGARIIMWDCHGGSNQQFRMDDQQRLVVLDSGKCLDVDSAGGKGARVNQWDCNNEMHQKWEYDDQQRLRPLHNKGLCLDIKGANKDNGAPLIVSDCHGATNQKWHL